MLFARFNCKTAALFPGHLLFMIQHHYRLYVAEEEESERISSSFAFPPGSILLLLALSLSSLSTGLLCVFIVTSKWPSPPCSLPKKTPSTHLFSLETREGEEGLTTHIFQTAAQYLTCWTLFNEQWKYNWIKKNCSWWKSTLCACKSVCFPGLCITVAPPNLLPRGVCRFRPRSITAGMSAALGGNNKKTRGHSPRLVYSAGPLSLGL